MLNRIVTGAHYGLRDWLIQRITAVVMVLYTLGIVGYLLFSQCLITTPGHCCFQAMWYAPSLSYSCSAFFIMPGSCVRDIVMDYVNPVLVRLTIHVLVILTLLLYTIWSVQILWGM